MGKRANKFDQGDLIKIDDQLQIIKKACGTLRAISNEMGEIPTIDRNIERIDAAVNILTTISEVLEILKEAEQYP